MTRETASHHDREKAELQTDHWRMTEYLKAAVESLDSPHDRASGLLALRAVALACGLVTQVQTMVEQSGNPDGFDAARWVSEWLAKPNPALGGERPVSYLATPDGRACISNLLARSQSGAYA
ncbi:MbcA/ParS/Xre antitoxin family protein [Paraburkholderia sediminicola]|uniref:antitoxin Xre/MbcA/ParS toxin-binding domain-containing protein n=1 Tax=Paraburkholderia sediminicola TaxID=458836 RepID=UPI0038BCE4C3